MRSRLTHKLNKVIFRLSPVLAERCNIDFKLETPSRAFMENEIFSYGTARFARRTRDTGCFF